MNECVAASLLVHLLLTFAVLRRRLDGDPSRRWSTLNLTLDQIPQAASFWPEMLVADVSLPQVVGEDAREDAQERVRDAVLESTGGDQ